MTLIMSSRYYYKLIKNLHFKQLKLKHDPKKKKKISEQVVPCHSIF